MIDPNPRMSGGGFECLRKDGIEVESGLLEKQARYLNRGYLSYRLQGRAWCAVKIAVSLDGRMAAFEGVSKWITGPEARKLAHALRADHDAVMVGGGTVATDNPQLTVRSVNGPNPIRVILSPRRGIPEGSYIYQTLNSIPTILITGDDSKKSGINTPGFKILEFPQDSSSRIDPLKILQAFPEHGILSVLIEGGAEVLSSFMQAGVVDEISVGYASSVIGKGISPFRGFEPESWESRPRYKIRKVKRYGEDVVVTYMRGDVTFLQV
jgi:diaminohydroxyphosphoribosylaminopyrimidine deaminase/5-amino-6-(5-phosphoribosylamino)uracil reductase